jgi:hypothetical protein
MLESTSTGDIYDPLTISTLKRLRDEAIPPWDPYDIDPEETRHVAERALTIQSSRAFAELMNGSDLKPTFRAIKEAFKEFKDLFKLKVEQNHEGIQVNSSKSKGRPLLELSLEINPKQGFDPQIRFGESVRLRYDYIDQQPLLEYGVDF